MKVTSVYRGYFSGNLPAMFSVFFLEVSDLPSELSRIIVLLLNCYIHLYQEFEKLHMRSALFLELVTNLLNQFYDAKKIFVCCIV